MFDNLRDTMEFDDLLFEKRNRDYGAYQLRKKYNSVVAGGIIFASLLVAAIVILPFAITPGQDKVLSGGISYVRVNMEHLEPPDEIFVPPPPPPPEAVKQQEALKYVPPVVVDSVLPMEKAQAATDDFLVQSAEDNIVAKANGNGNNTLAGQDGIATDEPYFVVEVMPTFRGGDLEKFREWVSKRTHYPQIAVEKRLTGTVYLTFIIEKDGSVSNVTVVKGVDPVLDNEAVKAIESSPKWSPGLQRGQPVRLRYSMGLNFKL